MCFEKTGERSAQGKCREKLQELQASRAQSSSQRKEAALLQRVSQPQFSVQLGHDIFHLPLDRSETVHDVKKLLRRRSGLACRFQHLFLDGKCLDSNDATLEYADVLPGANLICMLSLKSGGKDEESIPADTWRVRAVTKSGWAWDVKEMEFYADEACTQRISSEGATPIDSGHYDDPGYFPDKAFDGNNGSTWGGRADKQGDLWIGLQFPEMCEVRGIRFFGQGDHAVQCGADIWVERGSAGSNWCGTTIEVTKFNDAGWTTMAVRTGTKKRASVADGPARVAIPAGTYGGRPDPLDISDLLCGFQVPLVPNQFNKQVDWQGLFDFEKLEAFGSRLPPATGTDIEATERRAVSLLQLRAVYLHMATYCEFEGWKNRDGDVTLTAATMSLYDTTAYVIKPATRERGCSYVELVSNGEQNPKWFVSHWWGEPVKDFIACLGQHHQDYKLDESCPYWVCAYANNQWALGSDLTVDPGKSSFHKAMTIASGGTLSVVDTSGTCWTRVWCDYEVATSLNTERRNYKYDIYTAIKHHYKCNWGLDEQRNAVGITTGIAPCDGGHAQMKVNREMNFPLDRIENALNVSLEEGEASVESDRVHILNSIVSFFKNIFTPSDSELKEPPQADSPAYDSLNNLLRARVAASALRGAIAENGDRLNRYLEKMGKGNLLDMEIGCQGIEKQFDDNMFARVMAATPATLEILMITENSTITTLPDFSKMTSLKNLDICNAYNITALPDWLGQMKSLEHIRICGCKGLTSLPPGLLDLPELRGIDIDNCPGLIENNAIPENKKKLVVGGWRW